MSRKTLVCRCEDVTLADLQHALSLGYLDIEEVKRYTGLGTGPCQGKECMVAACQVLAAERALHPELASTRPEAPAEDHPFTVRPPVYPVALGILARSLKTRGTP